MRTLSLPLALAFLLGACATDPDPVVVDDTTVTVDAPDHEAAGLDDDDDTASTLTPPDAVAAAFAQQYPAATDTRWEAEDGGFEASFLLEGAETSVVYAADGTPGAIETEIPVGALPDAVTAALARDYPGAPVREAARIVDGGETTFEAEVALDGAVQDLLFREDGTLVEILPATDD